MTTKADPDVYVWRCARGHESAHSETEIRLLVVHPRCPIVDDGDLCWAPLTMRVCVFGPPPEAGDG